MIEVWEKLDCEDVGREEIEAIETVVLAQFGPSAVEGPMIIARQLADEGAELRHAEILKLDVERRLASPYAPMFRNILNFSSFKRALSSIRQLENLRKKFLMDNDKEGLRLIRQTAIKGKDSALDIAQNLKISEKEREEKTEIAEWFTIWLGSPKVFENWVSLRRKSDEFKKKFSSEKA